MESEKKQQWDNILHLSDKLQAMATQQEWEEMPAVESERQQKLRDFFSDVIQAEDAAELEQDIQLILQSNKQLIELAQHQQEEAISEVRKMSKGRKAISAYSQFNK